MIYISSACSKQQRIGRAIEELADQGFKNIELSGGTGYYAGYKSDILQLKIKYGLNFLIHNYFPPPQSPFILNLASLDTAMYTKTLNQLRKALELTRLFGSNKFGFHAGFFVDRPVSEIGKQFGKSLLYEKKEALKRFIDGFFILRNEFRDIELYIENNCYSKSNSLVYGSQIPFMLLCYDDYLTLTNEIDFKLLLDIGHLMVSANTCCLNFKQEFENMFDHSDYIHISCNDTLHDQNLGLTGKDELIGMLARRDWADKIITLEIYEGMEALTATHSIISSFI
jgi:sugar phosphate isomerase/epimerase